MKLSIVNTSRADCDPPWRPGKSTDSGSAPANPFQVARVSLEAVPHGCGYCMRAGTPIAWLSWPTGLTFASPPRLWQTKKAVLSGHRSTPVWLYTQAQRRRNRQTCPSPGRGFTSHFPICRPKDSGLDILTKVPETTKSPGWAD